MEERERKENSKPRLLPTSFLPSLTHGGELLAPFCIQRVWRPLTLRPRCYLQDPEGQTGGGKETSGHECNFPLVSPGVAHFLGPFLSRQPSGVPAPPTPARIQRPPLFHPAISPRGLRLPDALWCLSEPSIKGGRLGKHEKEPIWLLTSPPALLSLSSPLPYQPLTQPLPFPLLQETKPD